MKFTQAVVTVTEVAVEGGTPLSSLPLMDGRTTHYIDSLITSEPKMLDDYKISFHTHHHFAKKVCQLQSVHTACAQVKDPSQSNFCANLF